MTRHPLLSFALMLAAIGSTPDPGPVFYDDFEPPPPEAAPNSNPERQRKNAAKRSRKAQRARRGRR